MTRLERLQQTREEKQIRQLKNQLQKEKLQLESHLLATRTEYEDAKDRLEELKSSSQLSISDIIECQNKIESLLKGYEALEKLKKELY